jgi:cyclase
MWIMNLMEITQINKDVYLFSDKKLGFFNNSTVIFTKEGPIIIDVFRDRDQFEEVSNFIKLKGFNEPSAIIYTHWHIDHTCGNRIFDKCKIFAHQSTQYQLDNFIKNDLDRLRQRGILEEDARVIMPNQIFTEELLVNIGEKSLKLIHCPGHTYDSILIHDLCDDILIVGDNLVGEEVAFFMPPTIPPDEIDIGYKELDNAYKLIESIQAEVIIPGHGKVKEPHLMIELNKSRYYKCLDEGLKYIE